MSDVPSRHAVAVKLGPTTGQSATVYLSDVSGSLPLRMRQEMCAFIADRLHEQAGVITPRQKMASAFGAFLFSENVLPHEAWRMVVKARNWFFQNLLPPRDRRAEARERRIRKMSRRRLVRRERHYFRLYCRRARLA